MNKTNALVFLDVYEQVMRGNVLAPRGEKIIEKEDVQFMLDMNASPCTAFAARKFNLEYAKHEFIWYLRGNRFDTYIEKYASAWPKLKQDDGGYYSNYGQYLFGDGQIDWVIDQLIKDMDTRRASCVLLRREHLFDGNKDVVCTYGLNFRVRQGRLNMSVSMRSNDVIWGTTNDVFAFSMLYNIVYAYLRWSKYATLQRGTYTHKVDSLHAYERHWKMLEDIVAEGLPGYTEILIPEIESLSEATVMLGYHKSGYNSPNPYFKCLNWLLS